MQNHVFFTLLLVLNNILPVLPLSDERTVLCPSRLPGYVNHYWAYGFSHPITLKSQVSLLLRRKYVD